MPSRAIAHHRSTERRGQFPLLKTEKRHRAAALSIRLDYTLSSTTQRREEKRLETIDTSTFFKKIIVAGNVITVKQYEHLNVQSGGNRYDEVEFGNGANKEHNYANTQKARREAVRNLTTTNFDSSSKFVTLTFRDGLGFDIRDVKACNKAFNAFRGRMKRKFPEFRYLAVIEFQDKNGRGAVHYHMICNLPFIKKAELARIWGNGFVKINAIDKVDNVGAYISKYMAKDLDDTRLQGIKAYQYSRSLCKPVELTNWREGDMEALYDLNALLSEKTPSYAATYESDNAGRIVYAQYKLTEKE